MKRAQVITPWMINAAGNYVQKLSEDFTIVKGNDVTDQKNVIPDPNVTMVEITCADEVLAAIESDPTYHIVWSRDS